MSTLAQVPIWLDGAKRKGVSCILALSYSAWNLTLCGIFTPNGSAVKNTGETPTKLCKRCRLALKTAKLAEKDG